MYLVRVKATILNLAATAETFACTHYYNVLQNADALSLTPSEVSQVKAFLDSELKHKNFLEANGAEALATEFYVPENLFTDRALFVATSNTAENWFVAAYMAATRRFAELGEPLLAATTAQLVGVESEHQALIRLIGGLQPSFQTLKELLFYNTSEVGAVFQPFLDGSGKGFVGPAPFPGDAAINELVGDEGVANVTPFINLTSGSGTMESTPEAMPAGEGACTVSGNNTNVRSGAGTNFDVVGQLSDGSPQEVIGQTRDGNGFTWYQIEMGYVRSDVVQVAGNCAAVPIN